MADAAVSLVRERLGEMFVFEKGVVNLLSRFRVEIDDTMAELEQISYFLKGADAYLRHGDEDNEVGELVSKIKNTAFLIDDLLSKLTFKIASKRERGGITHLLIKRLPWILNRSFKLVKVRSELDELRTKISISRSKLRRLGIEELRGFEDLSFSRGLRPSQFPLHCDFDQFERNFNQLVSDITTVKEDSSPVISVFGIGGVGKTTLAMKVYQDTRVRRNFDSLAWATLSQDFQARQVWEKILIQLISATAEEREKCKKISDTDPAAKVVDQLSHIFKSKKCLIVLDDVWSTEAWNDLKSAFPRAQTCNSRILITTRKEEVAGHAADVNGFQHELRCLGKDESFTLFQKKVYDLTNSKLDENTNEWVEEMLEHCSRLPLAISLLAGLMSTRRSIAKWRMLYEESKTYVERYKQDSEHSSFSWLLNLSYDDLPSYLKPCLLYLCLFPEDHQIKVNELCHLWIAEGFVSVSPWQRGTSFETIEDVAYECLCELVRRSMVQAQDWGSTGRIRTCVIHDLIRKLCISKASAESFLHSKEDDHKTESSSCGPQRLAVNVDYDLKSMQTLANNHKHAQLRSLTCTNLSPPQLEQLCKPLLNNLRLLRVLKLENLKRLLLPKEIGKLKDLRFLSIKRSYVEQLPSSIGCLRFLQTLDLRTTSMLTLPNVIYKLKELRHLYLPCKSTFTGKKLFLNGLSSLQTLTNIFVDHYQWNDLAHLTNLRRLKIYLDKNLRESYHPTSVTFNRLELLAVKNYSHSAIDIVPIVLRYPRSYEIYLGQPIEKLPQDNQIPPKLVKLTLAHTRLKDDPLATLQKLPNIRILHLDHEAFLGFEIVCSSGGFLRLESLSLMELFYLEKWRVEEGALPSLSHLNITNCKRLMTVPDGLKFLNNLKEIVVQKMPMEFKNRVGEGGVDFYKVKHVPSLVFLNTTESDSKELEVGRHEK